MTNADHNTVFIKIARQGKVLIGFGGHRDQFDMPAGGLLIMLELLNGGFYNILLRLRTFVFHIEVGAFKMDAKNLRALIGAFHHIGNVGNGIRQNLFALRNGSG